MRHARTAIPLTAALEPGGLNAEHGRVLLSGRLLLVVTAEFRDKAAQPHADSMPAQPRKDSVLVPPAHTATGSS